MKYLGSKSQFKKTLIPEIQKIINDNDIKIFVDLFVGGANVIDKIDCDIKIGNDINKYLIALLKRCQKGTSLFPREITREHYAEVKNDYLNNGCKYDDWYKGLIGFCGAFRGKFFDSCACYDYISEGKTRNNYKESLNNLIKQTQTENFKTIRFMNKNYLDLDIYNESHKNSRILIYCDIPYKGTYNYNNEFDHDKFYNWCKGVPEHIIVLISEYSMPNDFKCIWEHNKKMCLQKESKRFQVTEKLFIWNGGD